jgi:hypothetical protein
MNDLIFIIDATLEGFLLFLFGMAYFSNCQKENLLASTGNIACVQ